MKLGLSLEVGVVIGDAGVRLGQASDGGVVCPVPVVCSFLFADGEGVVEVDVASVVLNAFDHVELRSLLGGVSLAEVLVVEQSGSLHIINITNDQTPVV